MPNPRIILYSQPACPPCFAARSYLRARKLSFEYKDIQADPEALRELIALKSQSTPTLVIGSEVMIGFDPERLDAILAAAEGPAEPGAEHAVKTSVEPRP